MNDSQLNRYSRHILLPEIDLSGQERLLASRILIIGIGGLGSPVAMYLAAAGVGNITLCDHDRVDLGNLQRQIVHSTADIGRKKVTSAYDTLSALNPDVTVNTIDHKLDEDQLVTTAAEVDIVVDASDNFSTRFLLNKVCVETQTPLVSGAAIRFQGQVLTIDPRGNNPCYRCLYSENGAELESCAQHGVLAPLVGIIASIQATETIKMLLGIGRTLTGRLLQVDATNMSFRTVTLRSDPECPICAGRANERAPNPSPAAHA